MMSQATNSRQLAFTDYAAGVLYETGERVLEKQRSVASTHYARRTGQLTSHLQSRPFHVNKSPAGARLIFDYLKKIRFIDMSKTASGKKKKNYHPIYNRILWGFIYGYAYSQLRYGFSSNLREHSTTRIKAFFKAPIDV